MTQLTGRTIAVLRAEHDALTALVPTLSDEQLAGPSGASEWTVAQALSHLGSGAEISRKPVARAAGLPVEEEDNEAVWARWDAASPREQAEWFVEHDARYVATVESLTADQRAGLEVDLGFLPRPVPLGTALGMRLNEVANHSWDVRVGLDDGARLDDDAAAVLVALFAADLGFLLGFSAKADQLGEPVRLAVPGGGVVVEDDVRVTTELSDPTATFDGPQEAAVRLLNGRLKAPYDAGVAVSGNVTLDDLRRVFPGY